MTEPFHLFWFRRDLRLNDNAGLYHALKSGLPVQPIFIFDEHILSRLDNKRDRRISFITQQLERLRKELAPFGAQLWVFKGKPLAVHQHLLQKYPAAGLFANRDYEPYALERDKQVFELYQQHGLRFKAYKDQVMFDHREVMKDDGTPYTVFTPYSKRWKSIVNPFYFKPYPSMERLRALRRTDEVKWATHTDIGFSEHQADWPEINWTPAEMGRYADLRDLPAARGTSRLSVHLRFGTVSIRELSHLAQQHSEKWLNELIWREFYQYILYHFPHVVKASFRPEYDRIAWQQNEGSFERWTSGTTGFALVDAGMRELNATGYMHNRVRMVVASFLTKNLLLDWRLGEAYFAEKLLDFDLASNNGGWQWAAGCGVDAAPYFRIFNPHLQQLKFDPELSYVKQWVAEFGTSAYPPPMVDLHQSKEKCIQIYQKALKQ